MQAESEEDFVQYVILAVVVVFGLLGLLLALWAIISFVSLGIGKHSYHSRKPRPYCVMAHNAGEPCQM